ncbi:MAG: ATP synthase F1 subunit gamma [Bacteroidetes bacterium]|nr:MAG: ATP synthase F1 subunit gamma [Bacteroidota bacterium]MBL1143638.1 ATP synthase F1 subunit gamma [Bacteroidota bacterium]MCB0803057.1 ATP synthase F1 subunit gamma [Flavobacteriales bacterium]NOG56440.1 ATP synthase F1 subunit gamma [Bacteroidota bacterium]
MANLKEIRNRITSVSSTRQITSAMKMVSAAKLRRAQDSITQMRPYANKLSELLSNLSASSDNSSENAYMDTRPIERVLLIPITSNRGLAGAFNANIIKETNRLAEGKYAGKDITVLAIGKKADDFFKKTAYNIKGTTLPSKLDQVYDDLTFDTVASVARKIMRSFSYKQFDRIELIYNEFVNAAVQNVIVEQYLPILPPVQEKGKSENVDYLFEPSKEEIITELIPKSLKIQLYKAILDSYASEHGARMTAMHKATDNATELIGDLKLVYNKARQASITNEILEIVGGAEALNN